MPLPQKSEQAPTGNFSSALATRLHPENHAGSKVLSIVADIDINRLEFHDEFIILSPPRKTRGAEIMSETFKINQHIYRAYPARFFCDGIEITQAEFYAAIRSLYRKV